jgi:hypothetical protein
MKKKKLKVAIIDDSENIAAGAYPLLKNLGSEIWVWDQDERKEVCIKKSKFTTFKPFEGLPLIKQTLKDRLTMNEIFCFIDNNKDIYQMFFYNTETHNLSNALKLMTNKSIDLEKKGSFSRFSYETEKSLSSLSKIVGIQENLIFEFFEFENFEEIAYFNDLLELAKALNIESSVKEYWFQFDCRYDAKGRSERFATFFMNGVVSECVYALNKIVAIEKMSPDYWEYLYDSLNDIYINRQDGEKFILEILIKHSARFLALIVDNLYFGQYLLKEALAHGEYSDSMILKED